MQAGTSPENKCNSVNFLNLETPLMGQILVIQYAPSLIPKRKTLKPTHPSIKVKILSKII